MKPWLMLLFLLPAVWPGASPGEDGVRDDRGRVIPINPPAQRIVSLYGGITEILVALGAGDQVVACTQGDRSLSGVPAVGTHLQPNLELIVSLKPDLVLQGEVRKAFPILERLEREGYRAAMFAPRDFPGLFDTIRKLGRLTRREKEAEELVRGLEKRLEAVARRVSGRPPVRVFFEVRQHPLLTAGRGSMVHDIITRAGGRNIAEDPGKLVPFSLELLCTLDPEAYVIQQGPMNPSPVEPSQRPNFQELAALRKRRVLLVEESRFSRPGPRAAEAVEILARFLHPEAFGEDGSP